MKLIISNEELKAIIANHVANLGFNANLEVEVKGEATIHITTGTKPKDETKEIQEIEETEAEVTEFEAVSDDAFFDA